MNDGGDCTIVGTLWWWIYGIQGARLRTSLCAANYAHYASYVA